MHAKDFQEVADHLLAASKAFNNILLSKRRASEYAVRICVLMSELSSDWDGNKPVLISRTSFEELSHLLADLVGIMADLSEVNDPGANPLPGEQNEDGAVRHP